MRYTIIMIETETVGFERSVSNTFQRIHSLPIFFLICFRRTARRKTCCSSVYPRCASSLRKNRAGISANPVFPTSRLRPESVCRRSEQYPDNFRSRHMPSTFRRNFSFCLFVLLSARSGSPRSLVRSALYARRSFRLRLRRFCLRIAYAFGFGLRAGRFRLRRFRLRIAYALGCGLRVGRFRLRLRVAHSLRFGILAVSHFVFSLHFIFFKR